MEETVPFREMFDADPDRGVVVLDASLNPVYANPWARAQLREHAGASEDGLLPPVVRQAIEDYRDRLDRSSRADAPGELSLGGEGAPRLRLLVGHVVRDGRRWFVARCLPPGALVEPNVRRLQARFRLTAREAQVALAVSRGCTNAETASSLGIQEKTVKNALMGVFAKCQVRNRVELALKAHDAPLDGQPAGALRS